MYLGAVRVFAVIYDRLKVSGQGEKRRFSRRTVEGLLQDAMKQMKFLNCWGKASGVYEEGRTVSSDRFWPYGGDQESGQCPTAESDPISRMNSEELNVYRPPPWTSAISSCCLTGAHDLSGLKSSIFLNCSSVFGPRSFS